MHSTTAFPRSCSIASAILFSMWNNDFVKEGGRGQAFYSQGPSLKFSFQFLCTYFQGLYNNFLFNMSGFSFIQPDKGSSHM